MAQVAAMRIRDNRLSNIAETYVTTMANIKSTQWQVRGGHYHPEKEAARLLKKLEGGVTDVKQEQEIRQKLQTMASFVALKAVYIPSELHAEVMPPELAAQARQRKYARHPNSGKVVEIEAHEVGDDGWVSTTPLTEAQRQQVEALKAAFMPPALAKACRY